MTVFTANTPTKDKNNNMSATSSLPSHFDDSPVLQVDLSNVMEEDDSHQDRDISYASPIPGHDHVTANETAYDLGAPPDTGGMRGNAFAHIESVQVIRRKKKKKGQRVANEDKFEKKFLLHPMTILFPESKVTAIMGPRGCGKTTLLNFVTGTIAKGIKAKGNVSLSGQMGFIPRRDHLHGFYTCRWYMAHYTRLVGLEDNFANAKLSMDILIELGMDKHSDTRVGDEFHKGLTQGQRRRLSVALEALSSPETLFCDEPTSDLDSESAYQIMKFLRNYSRATGRRVVITMHEPASFLWKFIDNIVLLSEGKLMYQGPRTDIESFFAQNGAPCPAKYNPADHYLACVSPEFHINEKTPEDWSNAYHVWEKTGGMSGDIEHAISMSNSFPPGPPSVSGSTKFLSRVPSKPRFNEIVTTIEPKPSSRATIARAMFELSRRYCWSQLLNPGLFAVRVALYFTLSLLLGFLFWDLESKDSYASVQSRAALLFYALTFFVFMSIASVPFNFRERERVEKEVRNGYYHPAAFHLAHALVSIPAMASLSLVSTFVLISMTKLQGAISFAFNLFLVLTCAEAWNQLVMYLSLKYIYAVGILGTLYSLSSLLLGFMIIPSEMPAWLGWMRYITPCTYSWRSLMVKEFGRAQAGRIFASENISISGMEVLEEYDIDLVHPITDMFILFGLTLFANLASFVVLHLKHVWHKSYQVGSASVGMV